MNKLPLRQWMNDNDCHAEHPLKALQAGYTFEEVVREWSTYIYNTPQVATYYLVKDLAQDLDTLREMADDSQRWK